MKIILFSRPQVAHDAGELRQLFDGIDAFGFECVVNEEFAPVAERLTGRLFPPSARYGSRVGEVDARAAVMLCYGGDGTLLEGAHRLGGAPVPVLGVNAGHLGFLTSVPTGGMAPLLEEIRDGGLRTEPRTLLEVRGSFAQQPESTFCLNEFTVQRHGAGLISVETYVDEQMVATYHGDGVIVSTPPARPPIRSAPEGRSSPRPVPAWSSPPSPPTTSRCGRWSSPTRAACGSTSAPAIRTPSLRSTTAPAPWRPRRSSPSNVLSRRFFWPCPTIYRFTTRYAIR